MIYDFGCQLGVNYFNQITEDIPTATADVHIADIIIPIAQKNARGAIAFSSSMLSFLDYQPTSLKINFFVKDDVETVNKKIGNYIPNIIREIKENNDLFRNIDEKNSIEKLKEIFAKIDPNELLYINKKELEKRVVKILSFNKLSNLMSDLSPDQKNKFDECIKRRPMFE